MDSHMAARLRMVNL